MSFYNMLFGKNPAIPYILATLRLTERDVERFRDCYVTNGKIAIYTRTGGGNRDDYQQEKLTSHPLYLYDRDDDFDSTYATFYFSFPDEWKEELAAIDTGNKFNPDQRWQDLIAALGDRK